MKKESHFYKKKTSIETKRPKKRNFKLKLNKKEKNPFLQNSSQSDTVNIEVRDI